MSAEPPWSVAELDGCFVMRSAVEFRHHTMRKPVRFLLPLCACVLSGCATPQWVKPEASKSDLAQDRAACVQAVQQPPPSGTTDQQQYEACMNAHGWKLMQ
jgi:hypothetical protein